jgi:superfamily II DNA or RNA helicase
MTFGKNHSRRSAEPRSLTARCTREFERRDWNRGQEYFQRRKVAIIDIGESYLEAEVRGSAPQPYTVRLDWSSAETLTLGVECSCPRFDDVGICKHVAAVILQADAEDVGLSIIDYGLLDLEPIDASVPGSARIESEWDSDWDDDSNNLQSKRETRSIRQLHAGRSEASVPRAGQKPRSARQPVVPKWQVSLSVLREQQAGDLTQRLANAGHPRNKPGEIWYLLNVERTRALGWPCVSLRQRSFKKTGELGALKAITLSLDESTGLSSEEDRSLIGMLAGNDRDTSYGSYMRYERLSDFAIAPGMFDALLPRLCASQRFGWLFEEATSGNQVRLLTWEDGPPWKFKLEVSKVTDQTHWQVRGLLERDASTRELSEPIAILGAGLVVFPDHIAKFSGGHDSRWVTTLRNSGPLLVPVKQEQQFVEQLALLPHVPKVELPSELQWEEAATLMVPRASISLPKQSWHREAECRVAFQYGDHSASSIGGPRAWYDQATRCVMRRDPAAEAAAFDQLFASGAHRANFYRGTSNDHLLVRPKEIAGLVRQLMSKGWQVESEGSTIRRPGAVAIHVASGVDWFDLEGKCDFDGTSVSLPKLLAALHSGTPFVLLDDGTQGIIPEEWLARYAPLVELGQVQGDRLRFVPSQAALLDALLAAQESQQVTVDRTFAKLRDRLRTFDGIQPGKEAKSFVGELRQYQREGLGWLGFLDEFGFGGCLADDMGLGKTVQILAFLDARRQRRQFARKKPRPASAATDPSLVVVPRSLTFNWMEEAARFAPKLRTLNYTGKERVAALERLQDYDLVVTTYGTLRHDITRLRECEFDYVILDEAQAIKNASSQSAKACRLLNTRRRLAMTGTPVENHLGELWSLFEFLNPGMLGRNRKLSDLIAANRQTRLFESGNSKENEPSEDLAILGRALRPFMLRRTKQQVLTELPDKTEQTLYCELDSSQRKSYEELRDYYRRTLMERVNKVGVGKSKIHVLEALLRLRQAACHLGLLDPKKIDGGSAKLDALLEKLTEVVEEGHKALVFSQFTSMLAIVRKRLERRGIVFEYLDGRTVKRQSKVERFQTDPHCPLFLISLKAGGQGLNLTAADYVFILDPWWNPAVEAQAVDRAHRIGQQRHVFAYRLIAKDTIEEKILQLQDRKRDLAQAIISADQSILRSLTVDDLQALLS